MVAHAFPRHETDTEGRAQWLVAEALAERGHSLRVLVPADRGQIGSFALGRVEVRRLRYADAAAETLAYRGGEPLARAPRTVLAFLALLRTFRKAIAEELQSGGFHLVHAWGWPSAAAAALADRHGRPFVVSLDHAALRQARSWPGASLLLGVVLRRARVVTTPSAHSAGDVARLAGLPRERLIPVAHPLLDVAAADHAPGVPSGVVFAGRLTRDKGLPVLLDALSLLKKQGLPLDLTIVGDGPERVALKAQALALGVPVVFTGYVAPDQVAGYLADKRVCAVPATAAGGGRMIIEALAQGIPCVATRVGANPEWLTEDAAGVLVPPGDVIALAGALQQVVSDDSYLTGAVNAGRALLARHTPASVAAQLEQAYAEARGRRSSGARPARASQP